MLFSSIEFLYYFLPLVILGYFLLPKQLRNGWLLIVSLVFYAWGEPKLIWVMLGSIVLNWLWGIGIGRAQKTGWKRFFLVLSCLTCLGLLGWFKYADFAFENINALLGTKIPLPKLILPIGISFYSFQILSYSIDVYRGQAKTQYNIVDFGCYVVLFPQLIAGPIVRYLDVAEQMKGRTHSVDKFGQGASRFVCGLSKKVLLANNIGMLWDTVAATPDRSIALAWLGAAAFALQIYFDFSGYSDMAIGLGKLLGFDFIENFNYPYISKSVTEFWRRWHISLGSWFRDYVYFPMGGSRVSRPRMFLNIFVVWMLTGFWHGADWNFIIWGLYFAVLLVIEKVFLMKFLKKSRIIGRIYVLFAVLIYELVGPVMTRDALTRAGDIQPKSHEVIHRRAALLEFSKIVKMSENAMHKGMHKKKKKSFLCHFRKDG